VPGFAQIDAKTGVDSSTLQQENRVFRDEAGKFPRLHGVSVEPRGRKR
jgi:hypothetical protein